MQFYPNSWGVCLRGTGWVSVWGQFCTKLLLFYAISEPSSLTLFSVQWQGCKRKEGCCANIGARIDIFRAFFKEILFADLKGPRLRGAQLSIAAGLLQGGRRYPPSPSLNGKMRIPLKSHKGHAFPNLKFCCPCYPPCPFWGKGF